MSGVLIWVLACGIALLLGGRRERCLAVVLLVDLASVVLLPELNTLHRTQSWTALGDVLVLGAMLAILRAFGAARWLLAAIGFQVLTVLAHLPSLLDRSAADWAYVTVINFCGYAVVGALLIGCIARPTQVRPDARP